MKSLRSPLILEDFAILDCEYNFTSADSDEVKDIESLIDNYVIDIDFGMSDNDLGNIIFFAKISINRNEEFKPIHPGYSIFVEGASVFSFDEKSALSDDEKATLLSYSALSITINNLRGFISALTAFAPFGKYMLPAIDVNNLLEQKKASSEKVKSDD